MTRVDGVT